MMMMMVMDSQGIHMVGIHNKGGLIVLIYDKKILNVEIHYKGILMVVINKKCNPCCWDPQ